MSDGISNGYCYVKDVLDGKKYRIPKYQRGYRWTADDVRKLLEDVYEDHLQSKDFFEGDTEELKSDLKKLWTTSREDENKRTIRTPKRPYCIQPLVVVTSPEKSSGDAGQTDGTEVEYDVIDGQQRLTTIVIARAALKKALTALDTDANRSFVDEWSFRDTVSLKYETRDNSKVFLERLQRGEAAKEEATNIDLEHMWAAYETAFHFYEKELEKVSDDAEKIRQYGNYLHDILIGNTRFIWYQVETDNPQGVFNEFNTGKIKLTSAELIKALFMSPDHYTPVRLQDKQLVMSEKWDEIENALHERKLWAFIPHPDQYDLQGGELYDTRIDIIFDFYIMMDWIREKLKKDDPSGKITEEQRSQALEAYLAKRREQISDKYIYDCMDAIFKRELSAVAAGENEAEEKEQIISRLWRDIRKIYVDLKELYGYGDEGSGKMYNAIGLYIDLKNRDQNKVDAFIGPEDTETYLRIYYELDRILSLPRKDRYAEAVKLVSKVVVEDEKDKNLLSDKEGVRKWLTSQRYGGKEDNDDNDNRDNKKNKAWGVVKLLLTYNIALLSNSQGAGGRFDFLQNAHWKWQREHIFACKVKSEKLTDEEKRAVIECLQGDAYLKYLKYIYHYSDDKKIEFTDDQQKYELDLADPYKPDILEHLIHAGYLRYDKDGARILLTRAIRAHKEAEKIEGCMNMLDRIDHLNNMMEDVKEKERKILLLAEYIRSYMDETGVDYAAADSTGLRDGWPDLEDPKKSSIQEACVKAVKNGQTKADIAINTWVYSIDIQNLCDEIKREGTADVDGTVKGWLWASSGNKNNDKNIRVIADALQDRYRARLLKILKQNDDGLEMRKSDEMKQDLVAGLIDGNGDLNEDGKILTESLEIHKRVLQERRDVFFREDLPKLLKDNFMGNMTLLTGNIARTESGAENSENEGYVESAGQNQDVNDSYYGEKKKKVYEYFRQGQFVPLGTLLVFTDAYTGAANTSELWLPDSRLAYIEAMEGTLNQFFGFDVQNGKESENGTTSDKGGGTTDQ